MSFFSSAAKLWHVAAEAQDASAAARTTLANGGSPLAALRAFAAETDGQLDDDAVAELEALMRKGIIVLESATRAAVYVSDKLADPKVREGLDSAIDATIDFGYACGRWRNQLRLWMQE